MRLLIAMMKHETNTFSPVPTPLARFGHGPGPLYGEAAVRAYRGTGTGLGAYLDLAAREGAEIVLPVAAGASPSGPVEEAAYAEITDRICTAAAAGGFDGIMLDLHGAMVTQSLEDGEGQFLKRLRAIDPITPIAVSLDMHANLYDEVIANATVVTGYRTYPHIDTYETAKLAGEILLRAIRGEMKPVMAWRNEPMLPHVMRQGTDDHPNKELQHRCAAMSAEGALAASLFTGFPHADITNAGLSAVVVTDGDRKLAEELRDELLGRAWVEREAFVYKIEPLQQSVARAKAMAPGQPGEGPIVLLDHYDNCASGGTMDTTVVLAEILRQGLGEHNGRVHRPARGTIVIMVEQYDGALSGLARRHCLGAGDRLLQWLDLVDKGLALDPGPAEKFIPKLFGKLPVAVGDHHRAQPGIGDVGVREAGEEARGQGAFGAHRRAAVLQFLVRMIVGALPHDMRQHRLVAPRHDRLHLAADSAQ